MSIFCKTVALRSPTPGTYVVCFGTMCHTFGESILTFVIDFSDFSSAFHSTQSFPFASRSFISTVFSSECAIAVSKKRDEFPAEEPTGFQKKSRKSSNSIACLVFEILCTLFPSINTWYSFEWAAFQPSIWKCTFKMKNRLILWQTRAVLTYFTQAATAYECQK